jgi:hypothetical protein
MYGHGLGEMRNAYKILVKKTERKSTQKTYA